MRGGQIDATHKRLAVELIAAHEPALRQLARRYSLCADDAEDAYQRTLEILLTKAPGGRVRDLLSWTKTVLKHEALAVRRNRERLLGWASPQREATDVDWVALIPAPTAGPEERFERRELVERSREALRTLKPAELRALTLLAEGYSYAEISAMTGFSRTKVNRCLAEGRERFRRQLLRNADGTRCAELATLLSAFCDGEASAAGAAEVREHLRACATCRATLRAYRAVPTAAAALAPALPLWRTLLERAQELLLGAQTRLQGAGAEAVAWQATAAGGTRGVGMAALTKLLAVCAGTAGGAAACVAAGVVPAPDLVPERATPATIERVAPAALQPHSSPIRYEPVADPPPEPRPEPEAHEEPTTAPEAAAPASAEAPSGTVEYTEPPPSPEPPTGATPPSSGGAAGEFGP